MVERGLSERECRGGARIGGEHLLCIQLPESDGRRPEKDQSPEVSEAGWQGLWITSPPQQGTQGPSGPTLNLLAASPAVLTCSHFPNTPDSHISVF